MTHVWHGFKNHSVILQEKESANLGSKNDKAMGIEGGKNAAKSPQESSSEPGTGNRRYSLSAPGI